MYISGMFIHIWEVLLKIHSSVLETLLDCMLHHAVHTLASSRPISTFTPLFFMLTPTA